MHLEIGIWIIRYNRLTESYRIFRQNTTIPRLSMANSCFDLQDAIKRRDDKRSMLFQYVSRTAYQHRFHFSKFSDAPGAVARSLKYMAAQNNFTVPGTVQEVYDILKDAEHMDTSLGKDGSGTKTFKLRKEKMNM
ncbi:MAG: hypothetical protein JXA41_00580 [Deltaproteobacteria bacterium]|nr:hypothetical protein [Deltaproteobacteria bacterium]